MRFAVVAEKRDRVALDGTAEAFGIWYVADGKPEEGHGADHPADRPFQRLLALLDLAGRAAVAVVPGRAVKGIALNERRSDYQAENRAAATSSATASNGRGA